MTVLTIVRRHVRHLSPASFGSRAEFAKSTLIAAIAAIKVNEAMNLIVIWTETCRAIVMFIYSLYSMKLVMRHQRRCEFVGEWPGRRVGKLGREHGLAATLSPQLRHN